MVFVCAAVFLYLLCNRNPGRWKTLLTFSLPFAVPLLVFVGAVAITSKFGTEQLGLWEIFSTPI